MKNKIILPLTLLNLLFYSLNAFYYIYIPKYLTSIFDSVTAGALLAIGTAIIMAAPVAWGVISDKYAGNKNVLIICFCGMAVSYFFLLHTHSYIYTAVAIVIFMIFLSPVAGLVDLISIHQSNKSNFNFGNLRIFGTIGFGITSLIINVFTNRSTVAIIFFGFCFICIVSLIKIPDEKECMQKKHAHGQLYVILKNKTFIGFLIFYMFSEFAWGYYLNFFPAYFTNIIGASSRQWGIMSLATAFGEIPFFLLFRKIFKSFSRKRILLFSGMAFFIRCIVVANCTNICIIIIVGFLTGTFLNVIIYSITNYITENINPNEQAMAQTFCYAAGQGITKTLAGFAGGYMTHYMGFCAAMNMCSVFIAASVVVLLFK